MAKERFLSVSERRLFDMSDLSNSAYRLYTLLLFRIDRKRDREPIKETNPFLIKYRDYEQFGISRSNFTRDIKELGSKKYIEVSGARERRMCRLIKW